MISFFKVELDGPANRSSADRIPPDKKIALHLLYFFSKEFGRSWQNETGGIFNLFPGIEEENILCPGPNINRQYFHDGSWLIADGI